MTGTEILNKARQSRAVAIEYIQTSPHSNRRYRQRKAIFLSRSSSRFRSEDSLFRTYDAIQNVT